MTPIKHKLTYFLQRGANLRLRIRWASSYSLDVSVGHNVDLSKWNGSRCRNNTTHGLNKVPASIINRDLEKLEERIEDAFLYFEKLDKVPERQELKDRINGVVKNASVDVFAAYDEFIREGVEVSQWTPSSMRKVRTMKSVLHKFNSEIRFADFDANTMKSLAAFMTRNAAMEKSEREESSGKVVVKYKGRYQNGTVNKNMNIFRWFLRWAYNKGYIENVKFLAHKTLLKTSKKPVIFLTWDELMSVYNIDLKIRPEIESTRDMFCFCCFTSLRHSDMAKLKWSNVSNDAITVTTVKTTDKITIDLNDYSKEILAKYHREDVQPDALVFPSKSQQKMNDGLKVIGKLCGINTPIDIVEMYGSERKDITLPKWQLLSTHAGRRTFICNALSLGISPNVVMKWTGHSSYNAMKPYIDIADDIRKTAMQAFNKK